MSENENGTIEETQVEKNENESVNTNEDSTQNESSTPTKEEITSSNSSEDESAIKYDQFVWDTDREHTNAVSILSEQVDGVDVLSSTLPKLPSRALNFILAVLILAVGGTGFVMLEHYSSKDREARLTEQAVCFVEYDKKRQLLAQKQYGELRIETDPPQALVYRKIEGVDEDFKPIMGMTSDNKKIHALTPTPIKNLDINQHYAFKLELTTTLKRKRTVEDEEEDKKGKKKAKKVEKKDEKKEEKEQIIEEMKVAYRSETFHVDRYQWIQDGATGSFRFQKVIKMVPAVIDEPKTEEELAYSAYYSFDWNSKKDMTFKSLSECNTFVADSKTDATICRPIPFVKDFSTEDTRKEEAEKKGKKR